MTEMYQDKARQTDSGRGLKIGTFRYKTAVVPLYLVSQVCKVVQGRGRMKIFMSSVGLSSDARLMGLDEPKEHIEDLHTTTEPY